MDESLRDRTTRTIHTVLSLLDRIGEPTSETMELAVLKQLVKARLGQFDVRGPFSQEFALAKRALVFWIDELLSNAPWEHAQQWRNDSLEFELYGTRDRATLFFRDAEIARGLTSTGALEVFGLCAALGFQGIYRSGDLQADEWIGQVDPQISRLTQTEAASRGEYIGSSPNLPSSGAGLPGSLREWMAAVFLHISGDPLPGFQPSTPCDSARDAQPLNNAASAQRWLIVCGVLVATSLFALAVMSMQS
ncbi:MAG: hypothetical protein CMJ75_13195 [Planctomycetaceae bacterium]|nr:hypothetical protein [Planctomycetaceae bacterium]